MCTNATDNILSKLLTKIRTYIYIVNFVGCFIIRNKIVGFQLIFNLVTNGAGNNLGQHKSVLVENNLDVITDNMGNMVIRPHLQDT